MSLERRTVARDGGHRRLVPHGSGAPTVPAPQPDKRPGRRASLSPEPRELSLGGYVAGHKPTIRIVLTERQLQEQHGLHAPRRQQLLRSWIELGWLGFQHHGRQD